MTDEAPAAKKRRPLRALAGKFVSADSYGLVIVLILISYALLVSVHGAWPAAVVIFVEVMVVWFVFRTSQVKRAGRIVGLAFALAAIVIAVAQLVAGPGDNRPAAVVPLVSAALYLIAVVTILQHIVSRPLVDQESALGAVAAYLCLGVFFAFMYRGLGLAQSAPFFGAQGDGGMADTLFFSMTTLTTTGYGNLVPAGNPGQTFAVVEMVTGQLFLLVAVGKVIAALPGRRRSSEVVETGSPGTGDAEAT